MKRTVIKIDEEKCNGCGQCVTGCHEGALRLIEGKARLISELYCDGLGACIGECPVGAIELEEREAEPYDEIAVVERIASKGEGTVMAHLHHLKAHGETGYLDQAVRYISEKRPDIQLNGFIPATSNTRTFTMSHRSGCPGSRAVTLEHNPAPAVAVNEPQSELRQWPLQMQLLNPQAAYMKDADVLLAADCTAFAAANFHSRFLKNKIAAISCPKLDNGKRLYTEKLISMIDDSEIRSLTVLRMEVPCCGGLTQIAQAARIQASRHIPFKEIVISLKGEVLTETLY
jgi:NAD-dependent dihydropyrimidine dehydrogenase PreA subunit